MKIINCFINKTLDKRLSESVQELQEQKWKFAKNWCNKWESSKWMDESVDISNVIFKLILNFMIVSRNF